MPRVSVITPFLNLEHFLAEAIESVISQTYTDWELILVDDGSTDSSTMIAREYADRDPRVRYFEHEGHRNLGTSVSRTVGINNARGELIAFLDGDDVYLPEKLEREVALLDAYPAAGMVYGATEYWYSWDDRDGKERDWTWRNFGVAAETLVQPPRLLEVFLRDGGSVPCMCGLMVRQSVVSEIGGFEGEFRGLYDDQVFFAKVVLRTPVFVTAGMWNRYRRHAGSMCAVAPESERAAARAVYLDWLERHLAGVSADTRSILLAIEKDRAASRRAGSLYGRFRRTTRRLRRRLLGPLPFFD